VEALAVLDEGEHGTESRKANKDDVKFEKMRHVMRLSRGMLEPSEQAEEGFEKVVAGAMETNVGDKDGGGRSNTVGSRQSITSFFS
jgi:hypothetical protein